MIVFQVVEMVVFQVVVVQLLEDLVILEESFPTPQDMKVVMMVPYQKSSMGSILGDFGGDDDFDGWVGADGGIGSIGDFVGGGVVVTFCGLGDGVGVVETRRGGGWIVSPLLITFL